LYALAAVIATLVMPQTEAPPQPPVAGVTVDARRHLISVVVGPFDVPAMPGGMEHEMHAEEPGTLPLEFNWPLDAWFRGYRSEVLDARGAPLAHTLLHHFTLVNFDRRGLFVPVAERIASGSLASEDAMAPKTIGAPMKAGQRLGVYVMWRNRTGRDYEGVYLRLTLTWSPANLLPRPVSALPVVLDVNYRPAEPNTFDVPPGRHERSAEFVFPISGRFLIASGHLHDQGESVRFEDVESERVLLEVQAHRSPDGTVHGVSRRLLALWGRGLRIEAGRRYRVVAVYNNVTADTARHAMGELVGAFAPDDMRKWPAVDYADPSYVRDLAHYGVREHAEVSEHTHHHMP